MIFQRLSRTDPERVFMVAQNNEGSTIAANDVCGWELASASIDGVKVRQPDTSNEWAFAGVADAAIASTEYGLIQVHGYRSTLKVFQTGTSYATGFPLAPVAGQAYMSAVTSTTASNAAVTQQPIFAVLGESIQTAAASGTVSVKGFIRGM